MNTIMNHNPTQIIAFFLCLSSSAYAQALDPYTSYWSGARIAGLVIGILFLLLLLSACCISVNRSQRRSTSATVPGTNAQPGLPYSPPIWQGAQTYAPPPGPPPGHPSNTASMNPYELNEYPGSQPPPPYVKGGEGVEMPQETNYSSPPGPPTAAHMREDNRFV
ncbi:hypothetical protein DFJ58DRAFT_502862 [Suillus subalutaceus]|uniref:uncharacterized protein n=1 Tax=Suillus subalutaceus TaxID=48586 RepID=UPI001B883013|nr:uncharacterized protein DFJ58DRAFT_502862 [Suillus subalutaceus]KAG1845877.1 hypothetical protein DFJ58DRAFT_502862 [Suillus subalutaceus]